MVKKKNPKSEKIDVYGLKLHGKMRLRRPQGQLLSASVAHPAYCFHFASTTLRVISMALEGKSDKNVNRH